MPKGVSFMPSKRKYRARITVNRDEKHLGLFERVDDAKEAYDAAAKMYFGEFARAS